MGPPRAPPRPAPRGTAQSPGSAAETTPRPPVANRLLPPPPTAPRPARAPCRAPGSRRRAPETPKSARKTFLATRDCEPDRCDPFAPQSPSPLHEREKKGGGALLTRDWVSIANEPALATHISRDV